MEGQFICPIQTGTAIEATKVGLTKRCSLMKKCTFIPFGDKHPVFHEFELISCVQVVPTHFYKLFFQFHMR